MLGAIGATVSTVKLSTADNRLRLPAASFAIAVMLCEPSIKETDVLKVQLPVLSAMAVPNGVVPSITVTVALASDVPESTGDDLLIVPVGAATVGAPGAIVSITTASTVDEPLWFVAASLATAVIA